VVTHAAANNQHALVAQGLQRPASGQMQRWVQRGAEGQLHHRDLGGRKHQQHRDEHAMVKPATDILLSG
jgi:hypothetical protein